MRGAEAAHEYAADQQLRDPRIERREIERRQLVFRDSTRPGAGKNRKDNVPVAMYVNDIWCDGCPLKSLRLDDPLQLPAIDDGDAVGQALQLVEIVRCDENCAPRPA